MKSANKIVAVAVVFVIINPCLSPVLADIELLVIDYNQESVLRYDGRTGAFVDEFVPPNDSWGPTGLELGPDGNVYITSFFGGYVGRYHGKQEHS
jgi:hypothetical protein